MWKTPFATAVLVAAPILLAAPPAHADGGNPGLGIVDIADAVYVDDEGYLFGNGVWIWLESNGFAGLQRGETCSPVIPDDCWSCSFTYGQDCSVDPDTLVF